MHRSKLVRRLALVLPVFCLASAASAETVLTVRSGKLAAPVRLDGRTDEWTGIPRVLDAKAGTEFAFQNDGRDLYVLVVMKKPEPVQSIEATGMTILGHPGRSRKQAKGVLFLTRQISSDGYVAWRESQGAVLTDGDKARIRQVPRHPISVAFAVDAKGSSYGPLRKQSDVFPPDFGTSKQDSDTVYEFRIPLASPDLVPGAVGGAPGASIRISFEWGGTDRGNLSTQASRESPNAKSGYMSGTGRTWGQEYLDSYDSMSRPNLGETKRFSFAVDVTLADAR